MKRLIVTAWVIDLSRKISTGIRALSRWCAHEESSEPSLMPGVAGCEQESRRKTYGQPVWLNHESPQGRDGETDTRVLTLETILEPVAKACAIWGTTDQLQGCTKRQKFATVHPVRVMRPP